MPADLLGQSWPELLDPAQDRPAALLQAAPAGNDFATLFNNLVNTGTGAALTIITHRFLFANDLHCLSSVNEHVALRGRGMIAASVVGGVLTLGARNWAALVQAITPHGGG